MTKINNYLLSTGMGKKDHSVKPVNYKEKCAKLEAENDSLRKRLKSAKDTCDTLEEQVLELKETKNKFREERDNMHEEKMEVKKQNKVLKEEVDRLKGTMAKD